MSEKYPKGRRMHGNVVIELQEVPGSDGRTRQYIAQEDSSQPLVSDGLINDYMKGRTTFEHNFAKLLAGQTEEKTNWFMQQWMRLFGR